MYSDQSVERFVMRAIRQQGGSAKFTGDRKLTVEMYNIRMVLDVKTVKVIEVKV